MFARGRGGRSPPYKYQVVFSCSKLTQIAYVVALVKHVDNFWIETGIEAGNYRPGVTGHACVLSVAGHIM